MTRNQNSSVQDSPSPDKLRGSVVSYGGRLYISGTSLQEFTTCPMKGYFSRVKGIEREQPPAAALMFGIAVHSAMERFLRLWKVPKFSEIWDAYKDVEMRFLPYEVSWGNLLTMGQSIVDEMVSSLESARAGHPYEDVYGNMCTEVSAPIDLGDSVFLSRTFDAVMPVGGIPTVVDFKTSSSMYTAGWQDAVSEQLTAYLLPHSIPGVPQPVQAMFVVGTKTLNPRGGAFIATRTKHRLAKIRRDAMVVADMIRRNMYVHSRGKFTCGSSDRPMCDFYPICYDVPGWRGMFRYRQPIVVADGGGD